MSTLSSLTTLRTADSRIRLLQVCVAVTIITLLARLPFVVQHGLSIDSYFYVRGFPTMDQLFGQGRFGQYMVFMAGESIGFNALTFGTLLQGVGLLCFAASVPLLFTAFDRTGQASRTGVIMASLMITLHPYSAEILSFSEASFTAQLATALGIGATFLAARRPERWWIGSVLLFAALSMYQLLLNYVALMLLFGTLQILVRDRAASVLHWQRYRELMAPALMTVVGLGAYMVAYKLVIAGFGLSETSRSQLLPLTMAPSRYDELMQLSAFLWKRPYIVEDAPLASRLMWAGAGLGWLGFVIWVAVKRPRQVLLCLLIAALVPLAGIGVIAAGKAWWPVPRVLGGIVVVWAMGVYWLFFLGRKRWQQWVVAVPIGVSLLGAAAVGHRIHSDQMLVNGYDKLLAAEIYHSLNQLPGFNDRVPISIVNRNMRWAHPARLPTAYMDLNMTAFALTGAQQGVLRMTTGHELNTVEPTPDHIKVCEAIPSWPTKGFSALAPDGAAVVCL
ncbi:glucosyltransferase domain-containing protein [Stenotrophomonas maltophilia]|uniref:glucosyltransferase domain-containing protein n=1 Tax=Stenotrophomonas maltophilia TaxID=40324 RepID=UPI00083F8220|nr:glucosyltransferase domain-containing protein [Stenotrophomonas maltophilia]MBY6279165.1 glucosyltransferase domain-containing protein [Stenotrophomonas maltophilia]